MGRNYTTIQTIYTQEKADAICEMLSNTDKGLRAICSELGISYSNVNIWIRERETFQKQYQRAREMQMLYLADSMLEISKRDVQGDHAKAAMCRLEIDTIKWITSKLYRHVFGDKLDVDQKVTQNQNLTATSRLTITWQWMRQHRS